MNKKPVLGKGLGALINNEAKKSALMQSYQLDDEINKRFDEIQVKDHLKDQSREETGVLLVDITAIQKNEKQPRKIFKEKELTELANSIKANGIIQPLIVSKIEKGYELIAGERRLRASKLAGLTQVPVVVKKATDRDKLVLAIIENVQRMDLNCIEEAMGYFELMNEFNLTQEEIAHKIGKERSTIANFLRILKLPRPVIEILQKDLLTFGHAKLLAAVGDSNHILRFANEAVTEGMSVRELEKRIQLVKAPKKESKNKFFDEKINQFKDSLEKNTGYHFTISHKNDGSGQIGLKYSNEAEFNDIYSFLMRK
jgi:ParB family chromosome partitioning protein